MTPEPLGVLAVIVLVALPLALLFVAVGRRVRLRRDLDRSRRVGLARLEQMQLTQEQREAVIYWGLHNRECRRYLARIGLGPTDPNHLVVCRCGGPLRALDVAAAEMRRAGPTVDRLYEPRS